MKKDLPTLLLEAERAFDEKFTYRTQHNNGVYTRIYIDKADDVKSFLRETVLSILSEAERATEVGQESNIVTFGDGEPLNVTVGFNLALNKVKSLWREWRGNLK